ncbi:MAG: hypothetical protein IJ058_04955 [Lachnospiraceae bacterium]|nr:hypothetical protein [Lachnospiraceae bacterium]
MVLEIIVMVVGIALVVAGYLVPAKNKENEESDRISRDMVAEIVSEEVESAKGRIDEIVDETVNYAIEKAERGMDRLSNEKMMAVSEYSDTVLDQINKSHEEVVFLYDMLNDKHENLKETVAEAEKKANEVKESVKAAESARAAAEMTPLVVEKIEAPEPAAAPSPAPAREKSKPVPVIKKEPIAAPVVAAESDEEDRDQEDDYYEEEWENLDDGDESDGPEINFNAHSPGSRNSNDRILEMHKEGKSNMAIAKELGLGIGEVKLVIDLFKG